MPKLSLKRRVEIAGQLTVRARAYFDTFDFYQDRKNGRYFEGQWEEYYWFFKYEMHLHRLAFILKAAALFKPTPQWSTVNFPDLVRELAPHMDSAKLNDLQVILSAARPVAKKLDIIRNNAFAHRSGDLDFDDAFRRAKITRAELRKLTVIALRLTNELAHEVGVSEVAFHTAESLRDTIRVFNKLGSRFPRSDGTLDELFDGR